MRSRKASSGPFFEDFSVGQVIRHASPRTVTLGDVALYQSLYGARFAMQSSSAFARSAGYPDAPIDDLLVYNLIFGKTVPETAMNSIAALGLADLRFVRPVFPGDTLMATSEVIGMKPTATGDAGVVYIRSVGRNQRGEIVLEYTRWTLIRRQDLSTRNIVAFVPDIPDHVPAEHIGTSVPPLNSYTYDRSLAGSDAMWGDYEVGERIDHVDGMTIEEACQQMACGLYQIPSRIHVNLHAERGGRFGKRIAYGGAVLSLARSLSFNGLANAFHIAAINSGRHIAPVFAGDTIYAWTEIIDRRELPGRRDVGVVRLRTIASKDQPCNEFPLPPAGVSVPGPVVLELDYWAALPR